MLRQGQTHHPYTLSFLGTWGHGDTSLGYIDVETGTDTPTLYTLISGDVGTWGRYFKIYTYGDRDRHTTYTLSFLGTLGHGDSSLGYIPTETGTDTPPIYTLILGTWGHGDSSLGYIDVEIGT